MIKVIDPKELFRYNFFVQNKNIGRDKMDVATILTRVLATIALLPFGLGVILTIAIGYPIEVILHLLGLM